MKKKEIQQIVTKLTKSSLTTEKEYLMVVKKEAGKYKSAPPEKSVLLKEYHNLVKNKKIKANPNLEKILIKRAVRTMSGVAVVSVLTKPHPCPGKCLFCPTEKAMPKSYLSNEPAVMRAILNKFDPYDQIKMRLKALKANGHKTDKVELIVMGGTWSCHSPQYQNWFIKRCFEALNGRKAKSLLSAQKTNETANHRCIGLTLETRPDFINEKEITRMRKLGATRVELGIQHIDDKILQKNLRGHSSKTSVGAIKLLKQAGFKINFHMMTGLYGSTPAKDLKMFKKLYTHPDWMPDMVKIYPTVVTKNSGLYKLWKNKKYKAYSDKQLLALLIKIKKMTPCFVRITRLIRDIPEESIVAGNKITNLRQLIQNQMKGDGWECKCIRCREAGRIYDLRFKISDLKLFIEEYSASDGKEYFLSYESKDRKILYAFLRLRINDDIENNFIPELKNSALIREVHTYGKLAPIGKTGRVQHIGLGQKLLKEAEKTVRRYNNEIAASASRPPRNDIQKIAVISGIGVRKYYEKFGYELDGNYMIKKI